MESVEEVVEGVVEHPNKPGVAVRRVVSYREIESDYEQAHLDELVQARDEAFNRHEETGRELERAEAALREQKSLVAAVNDITQPEAGLDDGSVGASSETTDEVAYI